MTVARPATIPRGLWWGIRRSGRADILRDLAECQWGVINLGPRHLSHRYWRRQGSIMTAPWGYQFEEARR